MKQASIVHIIDDDKAIRDSTSMLAKSAGWQALTYCSAEDFLSSYDSAGPGCLIMDVRMPGMTGIELQRLLPTKGIFLPVIVMSGHADIPMAVQAIKAGAIDFLEKPFDGEVFISQVRTCFSALSLVRPSQGEQQAECLHQLTPRENEILNLLVDGKSNKCIAQSLGISPRTVEVHRASVMKKLDASSLADLVRRAIVH